MATWLSTNPKVPHMFSFHFHSKFTLAVYLARQFFNPTYYLILHYNGTNMTDNCEVFTILRCALSRLAEAPQSCAGHRRICSSIKPWFTFVMVLFHSSVKWKCLPYWFCRAGLAHDLRYVPIWEKKGKKKNRQDLMCTHIVVHAISFSLSFLHMAISEPAKGIHPKQIRTQSSNTGDDDLL